MVSGQWSVVSGQWSGSGSSSVLGPVLGLGGRAAGSELGGPAHPVTILLEEGGERGEVQRVEDMAQRPQLARVVLQRSAREQMEVARLECA